MILSSFSFCLGREGVAGGLNPFPTSKPLIKNKAVKRAHRMLGFFFSFEPVHLLVRWPPKILWFVSFLFAQFPGIGYNTLMSVLINVHISYIRRESHFFQHPVTSLQRPFLGLAEICQCITHLSYFACWTAVIYNVIHFVWRRFTLDSLSNDKYTSWGNIKTNPFCHERQI